MNLTIDGTEEMVKIGDSLCLYDKLPQICKDMVPVAQDIQLKYSVIIVVGILNLIVMSFFIWKIKKFLDARKVK
jgi:hypothetical protein